MAGAPDRKGKRRAGSDNVIITDDAAFVYKKLRRLPKLGGGALTRSGAEADQNSMAIFAERSGSSSVTALSMTR